MFLRGCSFLTTTEMEFETTVSEKRPVDVEVHEADRLASDVELPVPDGFEDGVLEHKVCCLPFKADIHPRDVPFRSHLVVQSAWSSTTCQVCVDVDEVRVSDAEDVPADVMGLLAGRDVCRRRDKDPAEHPVCRDLR